MATSSSLGRSEPESTYAWLRLGAALVIMTIGGSGMYAMAVALGPVQAEFGASRGDASLPYTLTMLGFGFGGILMGRLADRFGVVVPVTVGALGIGSGFILAGNASTLLQFSLAHGLLIGFLGCSTTFAPLVADTSLWFNRRRGIAVAICASGNYLAGAVWPPTLQYLFDTIGWRATYTGMGVFCAAAMLLFALALRRRPPALESAATASRIERTERPLGLAPNTLMILLVVAGIGCCVAKIGRARLNSSHGYTLSLHDALPIYHRLARHLYRHGSLLRRRHAAVRARAAAQAAGAGERRNREPHRTHRAAAWPRAEYLDDPAGGRRYRLLRGEDRKSTSELQSRLHPLPTRRSSDLPSAGAPPIPAWESFAPPPCCCSRSRCGAGRRRWRAPQPRAASNAPSGRLASRRIP